MKVLAIIPAYNEEEYIGQTIDSLINQSCNIDLIIVDDGSKDGTPEIVTSYCKRHNNIRLVINNKKEERASGSKVVNAFSIGLSKANLDEYDVICKFDADLKFPPDYITTITDYFEREKSIGLAGGLCQIKNESGKWVDEIVSNDDHIRGALKAYRVTAFKQINGLHPIMGWDSLDELLLRYHGWSVQYIPELKVKHYRVTHSINGWFKESKLAARVFKNLGYNYLIGTTSALKRGLSRKPYLISGFVTLISFWCESSNEVELTIKEKKFINQYRWNMIKNKLALKAEKQQ